MARPKLGETEMDPRTIDLTGQRFGRWTVLGFDFDREQPGRLRAYWLVKCDCGGEKSVQGSVLRGGKSRSCGCLQRETASESMKRIPKRGNYAEVVVYDVAHNRVRAERGKASYWPCVDCGAPAAHWSYDHSDPDELVEETFVNGQPARRRTYSLKAEHYSPKCVAHNMADKKVKS